MKKTLKVLMMLGCFPMMLSAKAVSYTHLTLPTT